MHTYRVLVVSLTLGVLIFASLMFLLLSGSFNRSRTIDVTIQNSQR